MKLKKILEKAKKWNPATRGITEEERTEAETEMLKWDGQGINKETQYKIALVSLSLKKEINAELEGSEKQIDWAEDVREEAIERFAQKVGMSLQQHGDEGIEKNQNQMEAIIETINGLNDASWWIDNRSNALQAIAKEVE